MAKQCPECGRANPDEASYCYFDGQSLAGTASAAEAQGGERRDGAPARPLEFPSGRRCASWNEIVTGCAEEWREARGMLYGRVLEGYFDSIERSDLAEAARQARRRQDRDRGLDELLSRLPATVLEPARLAIEPEEIHLNQLVVGERRTFALHLTNQGMRLLDGRVETSEPRWLRLAPASEARRVLFRGKETSLTIEVETRSLPANKHYSASLWIASTGGERVLPVDLEVLPVPFPAGSLAGARTPAELAARAREDLRAAVPCFEAGEVRRWFEQNNWPYPIQAPGHSGLAVIQQYLEGLGLVPPPQVALLEERIDLVAPPRTSIPVQLHLTSQGGGLPYAKVSSDQPWLQVRTPRVAGRGVVIELRVETAELASHRIYSATVRIVANLGQQIDVPVTVRIEPAGLFRGLLGKKIEGGE